MKTTTIKVDASTYVDHDDCLTAAADAYVAAHPEAADWDLSARWDDGQREAILLDVPAGATDDQIAALRAEAGAAGDLAQAALCDAALAGDDAARSACVDAIADADAQADAAMALALGVRRR